MCANKISCNLVFSQQICIFTALLDTVLYRIISHGWECERVINRLFHAVQSILVDGSFQRFVQRFNNANVNLVRLLSWLAGQSIGWDAANKKASDTHTQRNVYKSVVLLLMIGYVRQDKRLKGPHRLFVFPRRNVNYCRVGEREKKTESTKLPTAFSTRHSFQEESTTWWFMFHKGRRCGIEQ